MCYLSGMLTEDILAMALCRAREKRGWSIYEATEHMIDVFPNTIRTLEGLNPSRDTDGNDCKLRTVLEIIRAYWPDVQLEDFAGAGCLFAVAPRGPKERRRLKGYLQKTG